MILISLCDNGDVLKVFKIVNTVINIIKIVVPILLILTLMIDYTKAVSNNDNEMLSKVNRTAVSKCVAAMLVFFIPTFINLIANISSFDEGNYLSCIKNATSENIQAAYVSYAQKYIDIAREQVTDGSYLNAVSEVNKLADGADKDRLKKELEEVKEALDEKRKKEEEERESHQYSEHGWWFPVGGSEVVQRYGVETAPGEPVSTALTAYFGGNDRVHQGLGGGHGAIDIGAGMGSYVIATRGGKVVRPTANERIDYPNSYIKPDANGKYNCRGLTANYVRIDHGDGTMSGYAHMLANTITVREGDTVRQGQILGKVGSSGCSTGPHLHFEVYLNGSRVDPLNYVNKYNTRP